MIPLTWPYALFSPQPSHDFFFNTPYSIMAHKSVYNWRNNSGKRAFEFSISPHPPCLLIPTPTWATKNAASKNPPCPIWTPSGWPRCCCISIYQFLPWLAPLRVRESLFWPFSRAPTLLRGFYGAILAAVSSWAGWKSLTFSPSLRSKRGLKNARSPSTWALAPAFAALSPPFRRLCSRRSFSEPIKTSPKRTTLTPDTECSLSWQSGSFTTPSALLDY